MFDPYHKWLGIPKDQRPPTYYQLLGLAPTEKDQEVIEEAAIRQTTHLRAYQIGAHAAECTRLLNEISQARLTLLNAAKRKEYDALLAKQAAKAAKAQQAAQAAADPFADLDMPEAGLVAGKPLGGKSGILVTGKRPAGQKDLLRGLLVGAGLGLLVVLGVWFFLGRPSQPSRPTPPPLATEKEPSAEKKEPKNIEEPPIKKEVEPKKKELEPVKKTPEPVNLPKNPLAVIPLQGMPSPLNSAGFTLDSRFVVHGGQQQGCVLRDWQSGRVVRPLPLGPSWISSLAFLPDGKHIVAGCTDIQVRLCDLETGQVVRLLGQPRTPTMALVTSPDGRFALTGGGGVRLDKGKQEAIELEVKLWELATGKLVREYQGCTMSIRKVALSKNGQYVFAYSDRKTRRWDREAGGEPKRLALALEPHQDLVFSRDGTQALIRSQNQRSLVLWDLAKDEQIREVTPAKTLNWTFDLSPDNRLIVVAGVKDHNLFFIDAVTGQNLQRCEGHSDMVTQVAFSADGRYVLSQARDQTLRVWAVPTLP